MNQKMALPPETRPEDGADELAEDVPVGEFRDNPWLGGLFRPLLIALVASSLMAGPLAMIRSLTTWQVAHLLPLAFFGALEGVYSTLQLGRPQWRDRRNPAYRLGEMLVLLLLARGIVWGFGTGWPTLAGVGRWLREPGSFFDSQFLGAAGLLLAAWGFAVSTTLDFIDLALRPDEYAARAAVQRRRMRWGQWTVSGWGSAERAFRPVARSDVIRGLMGRWAGGGIVLVLMVAVSRADVQLTSQGGVQVGILQTGLAPDAVAALLCYFLAGFVLLSEARLAVLRGGWFNEDVQVAPAVLGRWQRTVLAVLLVVGLVAALLPLGSTSGAASGLELIIAFLIQISYLLLALLLFLFGMLLFPLRWLFSGGSAQPPRPDTVFQPPPAPQEAVRRLPEWLGGLIFWLLVAAIVAYLAYSYLAAHGLLAARPGGVFERLRFWWRSRWARFRVRSAALRSALQARLARAIPLAPRRTAHGRLVRPGALPPRERVRYFYLSALRRAEQHGVARPPHETPLEFEQQLREEWPDAKDDVDALTGAFLEARYNTRPIDDQAARGVQRVWQRALRAIGRKRGS